MGKADLIVAFEPAEAVRMLPYLKKGGAVIVSSRAVMPVTAALAQEMAPQSRSMASSIVMGLSWGIANLLTGPLGMVADHFGIQATMAIVASQPLCALPFMVFFSRGRS